MCRISAQAAGGTNICAFLDMIAPSEGTSTNPNTKDDGYDVIVGGGIFTDYSKHPHILVDLPNLGIKSTAAGRYQILGHYADVYIQQLSLPDFGPESQDKIAIQMIRECHAISAILAGDILTAIKACSSRWASLPGNTYGQHQQKADMLLAAYRIAGGTIV